MSGGAEHAIGPELFGGGQGAGPRFGILVVMVLSLLGALQVATQSLASDFQHQAVLGERHAGLYLPWAIVGWHERWGEQYPDAFRDAAMNGMLVLMLGTVMLMVVARAFRPRSYLHGSATWATERNLREVGLLPQRVTWWQRLRGNVPKPNPGVTVGQWSPKGKPPQPLVDRTSNHILLVMPTRGGKGVSIILPTLLTYDESVMVTDPKGELWALTAGWRSRYAGQRVYRFAPGADEYTVAWNPLDEIPLGTPQEVAVAAHIALMLKDPDGKGILGDHWRETSYALAAGVILHAVYKAKVEGVPADLSSVDAFLSDPKRPPKVLLEEMIKYPHVDGRPHDFIQRAAVDQRNRDEREATSVISSLQTSLNLYRHPNIARNTSRSDFRIRDLMHSEKARSVYLVVPYGESQMLYPFVRLFLNMELALLAAELEFENGRPKISYKHQLLVLLDELANFKRLPIIESALSIVAGYGIRIMMVFQDRTQMTSPEAYGAHEALSSNAGTQIFGPPDKPETAEYISRLLGNTTREHRQVSTSGSGLLAKRSYSHHLVQRPLLTPEEVKNKLRRPKYVHPGTDQERIVRGGSMITITRGAPPILNRVQPLYWLDPVLAKRAAVPPPKEPSA